MTFGRRQRALLAALLPLLADTAGAVPEAEDACEQPHPLLQPIATGPVQAGTHMPQFAADVILAVTIDENGIPTSISVVCHTSPSARLPRLATRAVRRWRFESGPGPVDGHVLIQFQTADVD
jgi:TonB family protein